MNERDPRKERDRQARLDAALKAAARAKESNEKRSRSEMAYMLNYGAPAR